ncbi:putative microtubule-associated protein RP/EB [Rosa chinensis]|uniref:Putative microtubule-associated protein RP/EB n=1 Tax=Rosa chinensis TaxID=74649 RepID=A0A2P6PSQ7_ROSCH|nr:putative microtubule-associated protein RP/EB [Rosa chinensis]
MEYQNASSTRSNIFTKRYNALERREACKGGKEISKRAAQSQSTAKGTAAFQRAHSSHNSRRNDVPHFGNQLVTCLYLLYFFLRMKSQLSQDYHQVPAKSLKSVMPPLIPIKDEREKQESINCYII